MSCSVNVRCEHGLACWREASGAEKLPRVSAALLRAPRARLTDTGAHLRVSTPGFVVGAFRSARVCTRLSTPQICQKSGRSFGVSPTSVTVRRRTPASVVVVGSTTCTTQSFHDALSGKSIIVTVMGSTIAVRIFATRQRRSRRKTKVFVGATRAAFLGCRSKRRVRGAGGLLRFTPLGPSSTLVCFRIRKLLLALLMLPHGSTSANSPR